jgi:hypothetical protein
MRSLDPPVMLPDGTEFKTWNTDGHGIYEHDSFGHIFAHNLIGHSAKCGLHLHGKINCILNPLIMSMFP